jgi:hypothetical protein
MGTFAESSRRSSPPRTSWDFYLSSGAQVHIPAELRGWLAEAGFGAPRRIPILGIPGQAMYVVTKPCVSPSRSAALER